MTLKLALAVIVLSLCGSAQAQYWDCSGGSCRMVYPAQGAMQTYAAPQQIYSQQTTSYPGGWVAGRATGPLGIVNWPVAQYHPPQTVTRSTMYATPQVAASGLTSLEIPVAMDQSLAPAPPGYIKRFTQTNYGWRFDGYVPDGRQSQSFNSNQGRGRTRAGDACPCGCVNCTCPNCNCRR